MNLYYKTLVSLRKTNPQQTQKQKKRKTHHKPKTPANIGYIKQNIIENAGFSDKSPQNQRIFKVNNIFQQNKILTKKFYTKQ